MTLSEVKKVMHKPVMYNGSTYYFQACIMWLDERNNEFKYSLLLVDKNKNSTMQVPIEKVEVLADEL